MGRDAQLGSDLLSSESLFDESCYFHLSASQLGTSAERLAHYKLPLLWFLRGIDVVVMPPSSPIQAQSDAISGLLFCIHI